MTHLGYEVSFRSSMWEAMLQSSGIEVLDVDLILQMETYYESLQSFGENFDRHSLQQR